MNNKLTLMLDAGTDLTKVIEVHMALEIDMDMHGPGTDVDVHVDRHPVVRAKVETIEHDYKNVYRITLKDLDTSMTPEGKIKKRLKDLLEPYGSSVYQFWPMQNGMGAPALDVILCYNGYFISIELKAGKKRMTERQEHTASNIRDAGGETLLMNEHEGWLELQSWLGEKSR